MILNASRALVGPDLRVIEPGIIAVEGTLIASVDPRGTGGQSIDLAGITLLPGFIDSHVHIGSFDPMTVLAGGVTAVRDLAWPPEDIYPLAEASREPGFAGPLIRCVGPMLTVEGGYPTRAAWAPPGTGRVVVSLADAEVAVDEQARRGAAAIKVALNDEVGSTLDVATLAAICDAAHARDLRVAAHIYGIGELAKALAAGVDELAHVLMSATVIPEDMLSEMIERDVVVVPTLSIFEGDDLAAAIDNVARFVAAGGRVVYGTDLGNSGPSPGIDRREIRAMAEAGLDGRAVIRAATSAAADMGFERKGILAAGFDADVIGIRGDPLTRPTDLCDVRFVMREGRVVVPG